MSLFEDVMALAVQMPMNERERLARALGLNAHTKGAGKTLPLNQFVSQPQANALSNDPGQAAAWRARETGHAVVDVQSAQTETAPGAPSLSGLWQEEAEDIAENSDIARASSLPRNSPVIVHSDVCLSLAQGNAAAQGFWNDLPVEPRLATATYLTLLARAQNESEVRRVQKFVEPFAVLSLGPMASSRAVELVITHGARDGLAPLDALIAATALAHEIPLVTLNSAPFQNVMGLQVVRPF